jgi:hypothetical protein
MPVEQIVSGIQVVLVHVKIEHVLMLQAAACSSYLKTYYLTDSECQAAECQCTTNGLSSSSNLNSCSAYTIKEACHKSSQGPVSNSSGSIISTGISNFHRIIRLRLL